MSHNPLRKETNCLNCDAQVHGRFCHVCGQENIETKESFWSLTKHFVYDILHFDGKFFYTIKYMFTKPGLVARQYAEGKRAWYLHPIRMYLFTSAVFFLVFFSLDNVTINRAPSGDLTREERKARADIWQQRLNKNPSDTQLRQRIMILKDTTKTVNFDSLGWSENNQGIGIGGGKTYSTIHEYDSIQKSFSEKDRDGWFMNLLNKRTIKANAKYGRNEEGIKTFLDALFHKLPYLLFVSLPFFALLLKLLYIRRKNFFYSDHAVFTLYHYILSFILMLVFFGMDALNDWSGWGIFGFFMSVFLISWPVYLYIQMKRFYQQGYLKTFAKFLLLNFLGLIVIIILFLLFLLLSIFQA